MPKRAACCCSALPTRPCFSLAPPQEPSLWVEGVPQPSCLCLALGSHMYKPYPASCL